MSKSLVARRTIHVPGLKFKPMKIDPVTGGHLDAGIYDIEEIAPGETFKIEDDKEADKLVERGCAEWPKDKPVQQGQGKVEQKP